MLKIPRPKPGEPVLLKSGRPFKEWSEEFAQAMVKSLNDKVKADGTPPPDSPSPQ